MANPLLIELGVGVAANVGTYILIEVGKDVSASGHQVWEQGWDKNAITTNFETTMKDLPVNQGMLIAFDTFEAADGSTYAVGPTPYGTGSAPEDPLVTIGFSRKAAADYGASIAKSQSPTVGWEHTGSRFYWASKSPDGKVKLFRADETQLLRRQFAKSTRAFSQAARASQGDVISKLAAQNELFDNLENEFREELRAKNLEGQLLAARSKMRQADALMRRAKADRQKALKQAEDAKGLQNVIDLFKLGGSMTSFIGSATARADYAASETQTATVNYNSNVNVYINVLKQTTINQGLLPQNPVLP